MLLTNSFDCDYAAFFVFWDASPVIGESSPGDKNGLCVNKLT